MKQKIFLIIIIGVIFFIFQASAYAELFKYVDENGVVSYTDDYSRVAESARKSVEVVEEIKSTEDGTGMPAEGVQAKDKTDLQKQNITENNTESLKKTRDKLRKMEKELDKEFAALSLEKQNLAEEGEKEMSTQEQLKHSDKVMDLNNRIKEYSEKSRIFQIQVDEYNTLIKNKTKTKENN